MNARPMFHMAGCHVDGRARELCRRCAVDRAAKIRAEQEQRRAQRPPNTRSRVLAVGDPHEAPGRQAAIRRGELRHSLLHAAECEALFRAEYYCWAARRGDVVPGGDPLTGQKASQYNARDRAEGRAVHTVQARFWYREAAKIRAGMRLGSVWP